MLTVCAWCGIVIREGGDGAGISHGICRPCFAGMGYVADDGEQESESVPAERLTGTAWNDWQDEGRCDA